jgi:WD40 repeat protein
LARRGDGTIRLWDLASGTLLAPPLPHRGAIRSVQFDPLGNLLLTAGDDDNARLWQLPTIDLAVPDLISLAQLLSGRTIDRRFNELSIDPAGLRQIFVTLSDAYPSLFRTPPKEIAAWDRFISQDAQQADE